MTTAAALNLSRTQKAAVVLVAMGKPAAGRLLKFFKPEELKLLIAAAKDLRTVPQHELERIVAEFEAEFAEGAGLLDGATEMNSLLTETLGADEMSALTGTRPQPASGPPPVWTEVEQLEPARIASLVSGEHPQTAAVILSNLASSAAAGTLLALDKVQRAEVVKRMISLGTVPPAALRIAEDALRRKLRSESSASSGAEAQSRVAAMLNEMDKGALDEMLGDLEASGAPGLAAIRARLFSFEDVALLSQKARVAIFDGLSSELVTLALRNASAPLVEAALSAIGARARRMIEAELAQGADGINAADVTRARRTVASTALRLANEGLIELPTASPVAQAA
ncbi:MAG: flagellar motor switch protein FliG [Mesorhizobium amorphae]|nr:MAG: flagellar motor switch protein FliG [Mesorhizobium amorphae]